jgi:YesN/AraC family two-component response regulator
MRILVVDDHEAVRRGVCTILASRSEFEVCGEAANGEEAIEKAISLKPDLLILDINMPVLGGFGAAKEIQRLLPEVRIFFSRCTTADSLSMRRRKRECRDSLPKTGRVRRW